MPITRSFSVTNSGNNFSTADSCVADIQSYLKSPYSAMTGVGIATNHAFDASTQTLTFDREFTDSDAESALYSDSNTIESNNALTAAGYILA
tara:strand:+ start:203 stop:478 length:276 start_codon:yes stop_codon:yes gene_type:complete